MKKGIKPRWLVILLVVSGLLIGNACAYSAEKNNSRFVRNLSIRQEKIKLGRTLVCRPVALDIKLLDIIIFNKIKSFQDYTRWLSRNIIYQDDDEQDYWSHPEETLKNRSGDCEDYAFFNQAVLFLLGYRPRVLAMVGFGGAHAICVFKQGDYYSWMSNAEFNTTRVKTMLEFADYLFREYVCHYLFSLEVETGDWNILFTRSKSGYHRDLGNIALRTPTGRYKLGNIALRTPARRR